MLALQRGAGNAAVARMLATRKLQRVLHLGEGPTAEHYDLKTIDTLVEDLVKRRQIPSVAAKKRSKAEADIRAAVLVFYRNDRHFVDIGVLEGAVEDRLQDQQFVRNVQWTQDEATVAQAHPEREKFLAALAGVIPAKDALELWELTVKGVRLQPTLGDKDWKNNPHYRELSTKFATQLQMRRRKFALWSGGYDVSMYAQGRGYTTLEVTRAGKIYDQLKLFKDFSALGEMWNNISRQFVQSAFGEVHVFLRTFDP